MRRQYLSQAQFSSGKMEHFQTLSSLRWFELGIHLPDLRLEGYDILMVEK